MIVLHLDFSFLVLLRSLLLNHYLNARDDIFSLNPAKKRKYPESPPSVSPGMVGGMPPGFSINTQIKQEPGK